MDVLWGPLYWKENKQNIEVQNEDTNIIKCVYITLWRICNLVDKNVNKG